MKSCSSPCLLSAAATALVLVVLSSQQLQHPLQQQQQEVGAYQDPNPQEDTSDWVSLAEFIDEGGDDAMHRVDNVTGVPASSETSQTYLCAHPPHCSRNNNYRLKVLRSFYDLKQMTTDQLRSVDDLMNNVMRKSLATFPCRPEVLSDRTYVCWKSLFEVVMHTTATIYASDKKVMSMPYYTSLKYVNEYMRAHT